MAIVANALSIRIMFSSFSSSYFSRSLAAASVAGLLTLAIVYLSRRKFPDALRSLPHGRGMLLSAGAGITLLLCLVQRHQSPPGADGEADYLSFTADGYAQVANDSAYSSAAVLTYHNDNARTGQNIAETTLTPENVNPAKFGRLYSYRVDGFVYAQPLYLPQVAVPGNGVHNLVIVATQHDSVYAFDADSSSASPLWRVSFVNPGAGVTTLSSADVGTSDIVPEIGITSTPVADLASKTLYVVAATKENGAFYHRLHALDVTSGAEKFAGPQVIQTVFQGKVADGSAGVVFFSSRFQLQRAALLLSRGKVYVAFASYGDAGFYHGWVIAYDAVTLKHAGSWVTTPNSYEGGIWMSGCGLSADADGNLYLSTANGPFNAFGAQPGEEFSDSVVKLKPTQTDLVLVDFFTPYNQASLAKDDMDLGSAGVVVLPDQLGASPHLIVTSSKEGNVYLLNRDAMGRYNAAGNGNPQIVQQLTGILKQQMGTPAYWNGSLYFGSGVSPYKDSIKAFSLRNGTLSSRPTSQTPPTYLLTRNTVSISANGNTNGIVWAMQTDGYYKPAHPGAAVLHAYDARNLARELYNSNQRFQRDNPGLASKFTVPTVANGKVFVGTANQLSVYGLLPAP